jgi:hypothetical protein
MAYKVIRGRHGLARLLLAHPPEARPLEVAMDHKSYKSRDASITKEKPNEKEVFWPKDLLPCDCPNARIITWGYDSHVSKQGFYPYVPYAYSIRTIWNHMEYIYSVQ